MRSKRLRKSSACSNQREGLGLSTCMMNLLDPHSSEENAIGSSRCFLHPANARAMETTRSSDGMR